MGFISASHGFVMGHRLKRILQGSSTSGRSRNTKGGNSMVVQWLGLCASTAEVRSLVGELRSHKPVRDGKKKKKKC